MNERFWSKINEGGQFYGGLPCWNWAAGKFKNGYGAFRVTGMKNPARAHHVSYEELVGVIPDGLELDHLCRNRACVNPFHLEPVTRRVNVLRGEGFAALNAAKSTCPRGHSYDGNNLCLTANGWRQCSACRKRRNDERVRRRGC